MDLIEIASYVAMAVLAVIAACWLWDKAFEFFSEEARAERERLNAQIAEQHRLYDEEMARQERAMLPVDEALELANAEVNIWRRTTGGL
jgi:hypothetical protein